MKKLIPLMLLCSAIALAAGYSKVTQVASGAGATEPTLTTAGLAVTDGTNMELRRIVATVVQGNDAGPETLDLNTVALRAWKFTPQGVLPDAGTLFRWSRLPELDVAYASDAGAAATGYAVHNNGLSFTVAVPVMRNGSRITYTHHGVLGVDGGTVDTAMTLEGVYLPETFPR